MKAFLTVLILLLVTGYAFGQKKIHNDGITFGATPDVGNNKQLTFGASEDVGRAAIRYNVGTSKIQVSHTGTASGFFDIEDASGLQTQITQNASDIEVVTATAAENAAAIATAQLDITALEADPAITGGASGYVFWSDNGSTYWAPNVAGGGGGTVLAVDASYPLTSTGGTNPVIGIGTSSATADGMLSLQDWNIFNDKEPAIVAGASGFIYWSDGSNKYWAPAPAGGGGGSVNSVSGNYPIASSGGADPVISIGTASATSDGALSLQDWNTFNDKEPAVTAGGSGYVYWSDGSSKYWAPPATGGGGSSTYAGLTDTDVAGVATGALNYYDGTNWVDLPHPGVIDKCLRTIASNGITWGDCAADNIEWEFLTHNDNLGSTLVQNTANNPIVFATSSFTTSGSTDLIEQSNDGTRTRFEAKEDCYMYISFTSQGPDWFEVHENALGAKAYSAQSPGNISTTGLVPFKMVAGDFLHVENGNAGTIGSGNQVSLTVFAIKYNDGTQLEEIEYSGNGSSLTYNVSNGIIMFATTSFTASSGLLMKINHDNANETRFEAKQEVYVTMHFDAYGPNFYRLKRQDGTVIQFSGQESTSNKYLPISSSFKLATGEYVYIENGSVGGAIAGASPVNVRMIARTDNDGVLDFTNHYALGSTLITNSTNTAIKFGNNFTEEGTGIVSVDSSGASTRFTANKEAILFFNADSYGVNYYRIYKNGVASEYSYQNGTVGLFKNMSTSIYLQSGDYVELYNGTSGTTNSGAQLNVNYVALDLP